MNHLPSDYLPLQPQLPQVNQSSPFLIHSSDNIRNAHSWHACGKLSLAYFLNSRAEGIKIQWEWALIFHYPVFWSLDFVKIDVLEEQL